MENLRNQTVTTPAPLFSHVDALFKIEKDLGYQLQNKIDLFCIANIGNTGPKVDIINPFQSSSFEKLHYNFLVKYCNTGPKQILFLGMNPSAKGMTYTGVPFGDPSMVKSFLQLDIPPECVQESMRETSGQNFWKLIKDYSKTAHFFFSNCFIYNFCPLLFKSGNKNMPLAHSLLEELRLEIEDLCINALCRLIQLLKTHTIVAIGNYALERAVVVAKKLQNDQHIKIVYLRHPARCNFKKWSEIAIKLLEGGQLVPYLLNEQLSSQ